MGHLILKKAASSSLASAAFPWRRDLEKFNGWPLPPPNSPDGFPTASGNRWDFGGIGKGMAADLAGEILRSHGCPHFQVDCSGDLLVGEAINTNSNWSIATEIEGVKIPVPSNHAVACSGDLHQFLLHKGNRYSHIMDPRTGEFVLNQNLIFVIAPTATQADAWATALSVENELLRPKDIHTVHYPLPE